ncbi:MAG: DUF5050 domain-containing protein [Candidatus Bathyarchaeota archaeon]|nr:DUF5050 domain-containing protein [Candidatus Termiticorpusculum sp.]
MCVALSVFIEGYISPPQDINSQQFDKQGNTNGNIHNNGYVLINGDWIYYTNFDNNNYLYKKRLDGNSKQELTKGHYSCQLNFVNNWIYYTKGVPGEVYKIDFNGKQNKKIIDKKVGNLIVTNVFIFYRQSYDGDWGKLYKTDLEGQNERLLANNIIEFSICDGWIYYSNRDDGASLYKMDLTGTNIAKLNDHYSLFINVVGEYVYYADYTDSQKLYRIKIDGTNKSILSQEACWNINIQNEYLYYRNQSQGGRIYRMKLDGSENMVIIDTENCTEINVTDSFILYRIPTSAGGYFRANLDGSNIQKWE